MNPSVENINDYGAVISRQLGTSGYLKSDSSTQMMSFNTIFVHNHPKYGRQKAIVAYHTALKETCKYLGIEYKLMKVE